MTVPHPLANAHLRELPVYEPGRPIEEIARELGLSAKNIIKLASNENPLGPSPRALAAMKRAIQKTHFYPDGNGFYLRRALAGKFRLRMENVVLGNGSNEIIELLGHAFLQPGDEVIVSAHAFAIYEIIAKLFRARVVTVPERNFHHDLDAMLARVTSRTKMIFVANPNNPTGTMVGQREMDRFMARVPPRLIVVFDEAYYEFLPKPPDALRFVRSVGASDVSPTCGWRHVGQRPSRKRRSGRVGVPVVVLRTFSKIVGLAGLRIGYGLMPAEIATLLQKVRQPFNVNAIAQAAALASLADTAHVRRTRALIAQGRNYLQTSFTKLGLEFVPSAANFVLVKVGDGNPSTDSGQAPSTDSVNSPQASSGQAGDKIFKALLHRGIIVRPMAGYKLPQWIRVTVGTMPQNRRFIAALKKEL